MPYDMTKPMIYAALLLHKSGEPITEANVSRVLKCSHLLINDIEIKQMVEALKDVNIDDALSAVPTQSQPPAPPPSGATEIVKEEEKEDTEMGGLDTLFGKA
jgi:large subunit ribosomal protein L12